MRARYALTVPLSQAKGPVTTKWCYGGLGKDCHHHVWYVSLDTPCDSPKVSPKPATSTTSASGRLLQADVETSLNVTLVVLLKACSLTSLAFFAGFASLLVWLTGKAPFCQAVV